MSQFIGIYTRTVSHYYLGLYQFLLVYYYPLDAVLLQPTMGAPECQYLRSVSISPVDWLLYT